MNDTHEALRHDHTSDTLLVKPLYIETYNDTTVSSISPVEVLGAIKALTTIFRYSAEPFA